MIWRAPSGAHAGLLVVALALAGATATPVLAAHKHAATTPPDWTGVWERVGGISFDPTLKPGQLDTPPYNAEYAAIYQAAKDAENAGRPKADPTAGCLPPGMPRVMNMVLPMEVIYRPGQVTLIAEWMGQIRRIFTDGRKHPDDLDPTFNGHSIGHWEGGVLYAETVSMRGDTVFNAVGAPHSDAIRINEKFWQEGPNTLKAEITVEDPKAFTRPWVVVKTFTRRPGWELLEYVCLENNRNPIGADGVTGVILK